MPRNPFDQYFDSGGYGGRMPQRTYNPSSGGNPYVGQYRARNYTPATYQPTYNYPTYENYANRRPATHHAGRSRHRDHHDTGGGYSKRHNPEVVDRVVRFREGSDSDIHSYQLNPTSLRGADGSSIASLRNRRRYDTSSYNTSWYQRRTHGNEETTQPRSRHEIYTTPRRRDVVAGWFSRGSRGGGGEYDGRREDTDEDEIYRRVRRVEQPSERPRSSGFHRPSWFSQW